jgi:BT_3987-like, N-terminal domain
MKKTKILFISLLVLALSMTSCLKDLEDYLGEFGGSPAIIELSEAADAATGTTFLYVTYAPAEVDASIVRLNIASVNTLGSATTVTMAIDTNMVNDYNHDRGYDTLPPSPDPLFHKVPDAALNITSYQVTIPAGQREATWDIKVNPSLIPNFFNVKYLIGVKIVSVTNGLTISGNYGTKLVRVMAKNKYHGTYHSVGYFEHPSSPRPINMDKDFLSTGPNTVVGGYADLGGSGYKYSPITVNESTIITVPGRTETCYRVTFGFLPAVTWYTYDFAAAPDETGTFGAAADHNYCWADANNKWHFELYTGYNGTRKSHETMVQY